MPVVENIITSPACGLRKFHFQRFTKMKSPVTTAPFQTVSPASKWRPAIEWHASVGSLNTLPPGPTRTLAKPSLRCCTRAMPGSSALYSTTRSPVHAHLRIDSGNASHVPFSTPAFVW